MYTRAPFEYEQTRKRDGVPASSIGSRLDSPGLKNLAVRSLVALFDEREKLFSRSITLTDLGLKKSETAHSCTVIALLGLQRLAETGAPALFDIAAIRDSVLRDTSWVKSLQDLGLITRFVAECAPDRLEQLFRDFNFENALESYLDGKRKRTKSLAYFLSGIGHAKLACPDSFPDLTDVAVETYHLLEENQGEGGIFGHAASAAFFQQPFSNRFGTFADQVHTVYALATFARAFQVEEPIAPALNCANAIRALQGDSGQWWFLYDKNASRVVNRYPVRSLHQDAMAPLALLTLEDVTGQDFHESIRSGLAWVAGSNELKTELWDRSRGFMWDSIERPGRIANYREAAQSLVNFLPTQYADRLNIRFEATSDHFGWLLYAISRFAASEGILGAKAATAG